MNDLYENFEKGGGSREKGGGGNEIHAPCACDSTNQFSFNIILYHTILGTTVSSTIINITL